MTLYTDAELLRLAYRKALDSPDPSTQNGAYLVTGESGVPIANTFACNEFPRGVMSTPERWERPLKYDIVGHAERGAVFAAAAAGIKTSGLTMVAAWAACSPCAGAIISAGIHTLITHVPADVDHAAWNESIALAMTMLGEAGVTVRVNSERLGCVPVLRNGTLFTP